MKTRNHFFISIDSATGVTGSGNILYITLNVKSAAPLYKLAKIEFSKNEIANAQGQYIPVLAQPIEIIVGQPIILNFGNNELKGVQGEFITIPIFVDKADGIMSMDFEITFDADVMEYNSNGFEKTVFTNNFNITESYTQGQNKVRFLLDSASDIPSGSDLVSLLDVSFRILDTVPVGTIGSIKYSKVEIANKNAQFIPVITKSDTIEVRAATIIVKGDINGDNLINILDLVLMRRIILGQTITTIDNTEPFIASYPMRAFRSADINEDNYINILDLVLLRRIILGLPLAAPSYYAYNSAIKSRSQSNSISVSLENQTITQTSSTMAIPLKISPANDIMAMDFIIEYNSELFEYKSVEKTETGSFAAINLSENVPEQGKVRFLLDAAQGITTSNEEIILTIEFKVKSKEFITSEIKFKKADLANSLAQFLYPEIRDGIISIIDNIPPDTTHFIPVSDKIVNDTVIINVYAPDVSDVSGVLYYKHGDLVSEWTPTTSDNIDSNNIIFQIPKEAIGSDTISPVEYYMVLSDSFGNTSYIGSSTAPYSFNVIEWPLLITNPIERNFDTKSSSVTFSVSGIGALRPDTVKIENITTGKVETAGSFPYNFTVGLKENFSNSIRVTGYNYNISPPSIMIEYTILCDNIAPVISVFKINNNASLTNNRNVSLEVSAFDNFTNTNNLQMRIKEDGIGGEWKNYSDSYIFELSENEGNKKLYIQLKDSVGNKSDTFSEIILDVTEPLVTATIGKASVTNNRNQILTYTYNDFSPKGNIFLLNNSDITDSQIISDSQIEITLTQEDGVKTIYLKVYDLAGNFTTVSDTIILDQSGPSWTFNPVTWADTTQAINIPFTVNDLYSNINEVKLYYIDMDSVPFGTGSIMKTKYGSGKSLTDTFTIPSRVANEFNSGLVYYYLKASDILGNVTYYTAEDETLTEPDDINKFIRLLRQDLTPLSINPLSYANFPTRTLNSKTVLLSGNIGTADKTNNLLIYNSETNDTISVQGNFNTQTSFNKTFTFSSDGPKQLIFTALTDGDYPPANVQIIDFNIDITPPNLVINRPFNRIYVDSIYVNVIGRVDHVTLNDTVNIKVNNVGNYPVIFNQNDTYLFNSIVELSGSPTGDIINITATDFVGNTTSVNIVVTYLSSVNYIETNVISPILDICKTSIISSIVFGDLVSGTAPSTVRLNMEGKYNSEINLDVELLNQDMPIGLNIKTAEDTEVKSEISLAMNSVINFGTQAEYEAALTTVRKFDWIKEGNSINDPDNFASIKIHFKLPPVMSGKYNGIYRLENNVWKELTGKEYNIKRGSDTISAVLNGFSIYGVFPAGTPIQANLDNILVFPNPFRPNDGNSRTGEDFSGDYNVNNKSGIHIMGLTENSEINIYNISGQHINYVNLLPNQGKAIWNGRNKSGQLVASGVYLIIINSPEGNTVKKVSIIR